MTGTSNKVRLRVIDDGPGMAEQERVILDEGAETPMVHGSGLGLRLVYWIVTEHDGTTETTVPDGETEISIELPRRQPDPNLEGRKGLRPGQPTCPQPVPVRVRRGRRCHGYRRRRGGILAANPHAGDLISVDTRDLLGTSITDHGPEDVDCNRFWQAVHDAHSIHSKWTVVRSDGSRRVVDYTVSRDIRPNQHLLVLRDRESSVDVPGSTE